MATKKKATGMIGKLVVIRARSAGVHVGKLVAKAGDRVTLADSERLWYFKVAQMTGQVSSCSEVAAYGIVRASSKLGARLPLIEIGEAIEVIPVSMAAEGSFRG